ALPGAFLATNLTVATGTVIPGLSDETTYYVALTAINRAGESPLSPPVTAKPPGWPGIVYVGTASADYSLACATDAAGDVFLGGQTSGAFPGASPANGSDGFLATIDVGASLRWA